jgi:nucleoside-diphosphate-sugar epimerase
VYGPRDRGFLPLFRVSKYGLSLLATDPSTPFTLIHVTDLARAVLAAVRAGDGADRETFFIGHPQPMTVAEILSSIAGSLGQPYRPVRVAPPLLRLAASLGDLAWKVNQRFIIDGGRLAELTAEGFVCSVERARQRLDFVAGIGARDGFAGTAAWYASAGWM